MLLSWQMNTVVANCTSLFFVQAREFVIFLYKGLSQKDVKSITFTFVSQSGANFEIKFFIVY